MRRPQIFISYSTRSQRTKAYISALKSAFAQDGVALWRDSEGVTGGQSWRAEIYRALRTSDAAILLLSPQALQKPEYVQIEASYLCVQEVTPLVPILIDIQPQDLDQGLWGALQIREIQAISNDDPEKAARQARDVLHGKLRVDDNVWHASPWERMRARIADDFKRAQVGFDDVEALSQSVIELSRGAEDFPQERNDAKACFWLAGALLRGPAELVEKTLRQLGQLRREKKDILCSVLDRVAPHWMDEETALTMGYFATGSGDVRQFGIGVRDNWILEAYACRARGSMLGEPPQPIMYPPIAREAHGDSIDAEAKRIADFVAEQLGLADDAELQEYLRQQEEDEEDRWPVVVSFDPAWWPPSAQLLAAVRKRLRPIALCFRVHEGNQDTCDVSRLQSAPDDVQTQISVRYKRVKHALAGQPRRGGDADRQ